MRFTPTSGPHEECIHRPRHKNQAHRPCVGFNCFFVVVATCTLKLGLHWAQADKTVTKYYDFTQIEYFGISGNFQQSTQFLFLGTCTFLVQMVIYIKKIKINTTYRYIIKLNLVV